MSTIEEVTVDLKNPKNFSRIPTIVGLTFEEGVLVGYLLFLGDGNYTIKQLYMDLPMLQSEEYVKELRKQLSRKQILSLGKIGGEKGRPRGARNNELFWSIRRDKLQVLLKGK